MPIPDHATFRQGSIVSQHMDLYVSQLEIHKLQKAGSESKKTRTHISDIYAENRDMFEIVLEVYQLSLNINWAYQLTLPAGLVDTFDHVFWRTHQRFNK